MEPQHPCSTPSSRQPLRMKVETPGPSRTPLHEPSKDEQIAVLRESHERLYRSYKDAQSTSQYLASILGYSDHVEARMSLEMLGAGPASISYPEWVAKMQVAGNSPMDVGAEDTTRLKEELRDKDERICAQNDELERLRGLEQRCQDLEARLADLGNDYTQLQSQHAELESHMTLTNEQHRKDYDAWLQLKKSLFGSGKKLGQKQLMKKAHKLEKEGKIDRNLLKTEPYGEFPMHTAADDHASTLTVAHATTEPPQAGTPLRSVQLSSPTTLVASANPDVKIPPLSPTRKRLNEMKAAVLVSSPRSPFNTPRRRRNNLKQRTPGSASHSKENKSPSKRETDEDVISIPSSSSSDLRAAVLLSPSKNKQQSPKKQSPKKHQVTPKRKFSDGFSSETEDESQPPLARSLLSALRNAGSASPSKFKKFPSSPRHHDSPRKQDRSPATCSNFTSKLPISPSRKLKRHNDALQMITPKPTRHSDIGTRGSKTDEPVKKKMRLSLDGAAAGPSTGGKGKGKANQIDYSSYKGRGRYAPVAGEKNINATYEIDAAQNGGVQHQFHEVVRNKNDRRQLHGEDCDCCRDYYAAVGALPPRLQPPLWASPKRDPHSKNVDAVDAHRQSVSRHRAQWTRAPTPPAYWNIGFPDTQEVEDINQKARKMQQRKLDDIERSVARGDGKYIRRN